MSEVERIRERIRVGCSPVPHAASRIAAVGSRDKSFSWFNLSPKKIIIQGQSDREILSTFLEEMHKGYLTSC